MVASEYIMKLRLIRMKDGTKAKCVSFGLQVLGIMRHRKEKEGLYTHSTISYFHSHSIVGHASAYSDTYMERLQTQKLGDRS